MKRIISVLAGLTALTILGLVLLRDIGPNPTASPATVADTPAAASAPHDKLDLQLSRRLAQPPDSAPATTPPRGRLLAQPEIWHYLAYLLAAALIGFAVSRAWPRRAPANDSTTVQALRGEVAERDDALRALEAEFERNVSDQATGLSDPLRYELEAQSEELERLHHEIQQRDAAIESHVRQIHEQIARTGSLEDEISAAVQRGDQLQRDLAERERQLETIQEREQGASEGKDRQLASLEQELSTWKDSVSALERELDERLAQLDALAHEKTSASTSSAVLQNEHGQLQGLVQTLREQLETNATAARAERDEYRQRAEALENLLEKRTLQIDSLGDQLDEKNALIDELRHAVEAGQQQILAVETELGDLQGYRDKLNSWESTLLTLRADLDRRDAVIDELRSATARLGQTEQQVIDQQNTIAALEAELDKSAELTQSLKRGVDRLRHYKDIAEQRHQTNQELQGELRDARDETEQWRNRIPGLEKAIAERDARIDALQERLDRQGGDANELENELADWRIKVTALETALRERDAGLDDLRTQIEAANAGRDTLSARLEETEEVRVSLDAELEYLSEELEKSTALLQQEKEQREALAAETHRLRDIDDKLREWNSTVTTLRADLRERDRSLHTLLDDFGALIGDRVSVQGWAAALDGLRNNINARNQEIERYRQEVARLEDVAGQLPAHEATIADLEQAVAEGQTENEELFGQIAQLDETVASLRASEQEVERLQHNLDERNADLEAIRSELDRNQGAITRAEDLQFEAERQRVSLTALQQALSEREERVDELEMDVADWIDRHASLKSQVESLEERLATLKTQTGPEPEAIPTLRTRAPGSQSLPTLTAVVRRPPDEDQG